MLNISHIIPPEHVASVVWDGDSIKYDTELYQLGKNLKEFWVLHPDCAGDTEVLNLVKKIPKTTRCVIIAYGDKWLAKLFKHGWTPNHGYEVVEVKLNVVVNPIFSDLDFRIDYTIPWHDLKYEHMWMLDSKHTRDAQEPVWAVKVNVIDSPKGTKVMWDIEPYGELEINEEVSVPFELPKDFAVQHYDFSYEHVWISKEHDEKIWLAKLTYVDNPKGVKEVDMTDRLNPNKLDVVFISYGELNAEDNWNRVKEKAPWAQRVDGVKGILEAHKAAARLARTDMFYVVDGDALLLKKWEFKYRPSIFDRDCTYIWSAKNPLTDLTYGHGGVKLFSRSKLLKIKKWRTLDMTTSVSEKIKVMSEISNWTAFNTDEFSTWKTAFRECVKLVFNMNRYPENPEHGIRLDKWKEIDQSKPFGKIAMQATEQAIEFVESNSFDMATLININNRDWLETLYNSTYQKAKNDRQHQSA
jgi:hypothetical protein